MKTALFGLLSLWMGALVWPGCDDKDEGSPAMTLYIRENTPLSRAMDPAMDLDTAKFLVTDMYLRRWGALDSVRLLEGPIVIDLDVEGTMTRIDAFHAPAGSFDRISFVIHKAAVDEYYLPDPDFRIGPGEDQRFSILANGWRDRVPFHYRSINSIATSVPIDPVLVIDDSIGTANLTLVVDANSWFANGLGGYLDPDDLGTHDEIQVNILSSFTAFRDDNMDGFADN